MTTRRVFLKGSALAMFGVGAMPAWLSRSVYAAEVAQRRKKILVAIFQRGAVDGLNMVVPFGEPRYYELRPSHRDSETGRHAAIRRRPGRILRTAPVARAAEADVRRAAPGDRGRGRVARPDAVAFRRAGLHGVGNAGPEGDHGRLAESCAAARNPAPCRRCARLAWVRTWRAVVRGHNDAVAVNNLNDFQVRDPRGAATFESMYDATLDTMLHGTGKETFRAVKMMQAIAEAEPTSRQRREISQWTVRPTACSKSRG